MLPGRLVAKNNFGFLDPSAGEGAYLGCMLVTLVHSRVSSIWFKYSREPPRHMVAPPFHLGTPQLYKMITDLFSLCFFINLFVKSEFVIIPKGGGLKGAPFI